MTTIAPIFLTLAALALGFVITSTVAQVWRLFAG